MPIDSIPDGNWDAVIKYLFEQQSDVILTSSIVSADTLHLGTGLGLYCLINIGDNNGDRKDEIALVTDYCDFSNLNSCKIYSLCKRKWTVLNTFGVNEMAFVFHGEEVPVFNNIPGFLENREGYWQYSDYDEEAERSTEDAKMEKLEVKGCNE